MDKKRHWETVYETKASTEVSWYQTRPKLSLQNILRVAPNRDAEIIDVGGGTSTLVDHLLKEGYTNLTVLDISAKALEVAKARLGKDAACVTWIIGDATAISLPAKYDVWHDRAVFHFLTEVDDRQNYRSVIVQSLKPKGTVLIATFAEDGPTRCSGLDVRRYSRENLAQEFGKEFRLVKSWTELHQTPSETEQKFIYCQFTKN